MGVVDEDIGNAAARQGHQMMFDQAARSCHEQRFGHPIGQGTHALARPAASIIAFIALPNLSGQGGSVAVTASGRL